MILLPPPLPQSDFESEEKYKLYLDQRSRYQKNYKITEKIYDFFLKLGIGLIFLIAVIFCYVLISDFGWYVLLIPIGAVLVYYTGKLIFNLIEGQIK